jgi:hypothetical protein
VQFRSLHHRQRALWNLAGLLEGELVDPVHAEYRTLVDERGAVYATNSQASPSRHDSNG